MELISNEQFDIAELIVDTRKVHRHLFLDLTPSGYEYFAGHYRGEQFPELENYEIVRLPGALQDCCKAPAVPQVMQRFGLAIKKGIQKLDSFTSQNSPKDSLNGVVKFACDACVTFCQIHPYANGNGHISRFMIIAILSRYGYTVNDFYIDPRPISRNYIPFVIQYGRGNKLPLLYWLTTLISISSDQSV